MAEYDVVVVGAGPAGLCAAKSAAEKGAKTIILERNTSIGVPPESSALIHATPYTEEIVKSLPERVILQRPKRWCFYAPSGKRLKEAPRGQQGEALVLREEFYRELARQAIRAGAAVVLNTNVEGLIKEGGQTKGVVTNSKTLPKVMAKVVVAGGGIPSRHDGITHQEGMIRPDEAFRTSFIHDVVGVKGDPYALETVFGMDVRRHWTTLWPRGGDRYILTSNTLEQFEEMKKGKYFLGRKLRDAYQLWVHEYLVGNMGGLIMPNGIVRDGLILTGDAAGYEGIAHAVVSGRWAGDMAAQAVHSGDTSMENLMAYQKMCYAKLPYLNLVASIFKGGLTTMLKIRNLNSHEELERELTKMAEAGEFLDGEIECPTPEEMPDMTSVRAQSE
ncbi:MAG: NAD(P)/FAD-dependent oxidoreductase [Chloroflexota bacterium]